MFTVKAIKSWYQIHKWTSLICTAFLLLLCLTGLPLIFHHELDHLLGNEAEPPTLPAGTPMADLDLVVAAGAKRYPNEYVQFVVWEADEPDIVYLSMAAAPSAPPENNRTIVVDARTAQTLNEPKTNEGLMYVLLKLHVDMFAGLPGKLFLGLMGLLFAASIVSGAIVYGPFMRRLDFGVVRKDKAPRLKWLDLHNLLGIATLIWATVVGLTGVINTWADLTIKLWQFDQLSAMVAPYKDKPPPAQLGSVNRAVFTAQAALPEMKPAFVAFPGTLFSSNHHYAVFMRGDSPATARLLKPALIDAQTGRLTDTRDLPWYVSLLLLSQPLHFGDYGGAPMKILWALFDVGAIVVLGSGLYLWITRRKTSIESYLDSLASLEATKTGGVG
ncbi:MAG TPA: PepSY domain-containing protein [Blastocatellia bacterium]|jgi:uncharacterized iron-regulated membrane protein|nr:PepSY domain-containing protein [Blastocatellia bacterium]